MSNVDLTLLDRLGRTIDSSGGPPHDGDMLERVKKLEEMAQKTNDRLGSVDTRLTKIETKLETFATKEDVRAVIVDLHKEISAQTWKLVTFVCGFGTALVAATYFIATHIKP